MGGQDLVIYNFFIDLGWGGGWDVKRLTFKTETSACVHLRLSTSAYGL